jgi:hypothetical protein
MVFELDGRYRIAVERAEGLREEAARERLAHGAAWADPSPGTSLRTALGDLLIRVGRALGGDHRRGDATTASAVTSGPLQDGPVAAGGGGENGTWVVSLTGAPLSPPPSPSRAGMAAAWMARSVPRDGLDRLLRDLDRLGRELPAGGTGET